MTRPSKYPHLSLCRPGLHNGTGFTIIEILVAIGILVLIFAIGLLMSMDVYHGYSRRSERDTFVSVLQRARSRAMANVNQSAWGVCTSGGNHLIFKGSTYSPSAVTETIQGNPAVVITDTSAPKRLACSDGGIAFMQLTGDASSTRVTLTQGAITSTISTNTEGTIIW